MKYIIQLLSIVLLLSACSTQTAQSIVSPAITLTATYQITKIHQPTETPTLPITETPASKKIISITETHVAELSVKATVASVGTICQSPTSDYHSEISPDNLWIAMICRGQYGVADSYLRVMSIQGNKNWNVNHADYAKVAEYDTDGMIYPFHWSADGKYLYVTSASRMSGCCWIGGDLLLVRLNLENGTQTEIANYISNGSGISGANFSISPTERYVILIPQDGSDNLYVLDLYTWKQRAIKLKFKNTGAGYAVMSNDEKKIIFVLREYPKEYQSDLTFGSIVLIDITTGTQTKLLSSPEFWDTPMPISWKDNTHVLLCNKMCSDSQSLLLLNINTRELTEAGNP